MATTRRIINTKLTCLICLGAGVVDDEVCSECGGTGQIDHPICIGCGRLEWECTCDQSEEPPDNIPERDDDQISK